MLGYWKNIKATTKTRTIHPTIKITLLTFPEKISMPKGLSNNPKMPHIMSSHIPTMKHSGRAATKTVKPHNIKGIARHPSPDSNISLGFAIWIINYKITKKISRQWRRIKHISTSHNALRNLCRVVQSCPWTLHNLRPIKTRLKKRF